MREITTAIIIVLLLYSTVQYYELAGNIFSEQECRSQVVSKTLQTFVENLIFLQPLLKTKESTVV